MGVGTNVQNRAVALHHMDCPWRPADLAQRDGRIIRQGNQNPQVRVIRYATEASFDVYMWQTVERKAAFIHQITAGTVAERSVEDVGDTTLSFAEVKALASGNPLIIEHAELTADVTRLERLADAHRADQTRLQRIVDTAGRTVELCTDRIGQYEAAIAHRVDTRGDRFTMTVTGHEHRARSDAGQALKDELARRLRTFEQHPEPLGRLAGFDLQATVTQGHDPAATIVVADTPISVTFDRAAIVAGDPVTLIRWLEQPIQTLDTKLADTRIEHDHALKRRAAAEARIGLPFEHAQPLKDLQRRLAEVTTQLAPPDPDEPSAGDDATASPDEPTRGVPTARTRPSGPPSTPPPRQHHDRDSQDLQR